jgi:hypothetical protein
MVINLFDEPKMHYNPVLDIPIDKSNSFCVDMEYYKRTFKGTDNPLDETIIHRTKQILGHAMLLEKVVPQKYDMIIRTRYDTVISTQVDFLSLLNDSYNNNCAIGFGLKPKIDNNLNVLKEVNKSININGEITYSWYKFLMDFMIFHPRKMFDIDLVWKLHNEKKLLVSETGWYQVLSWPFGDNHKCISGGAQIERYFIK